MKNIVTKTISTLEKMKDDIDSVDNSLKNHTPVDFYALQRLILRDLVKVGAFDKARICGFTRRNIREMSEFPERYGQQIIRLSRYMLKSGYYKRLVNYFVTLPKCRWVLDTSIRNSSFSSVKETTLRKSFISCAGHIDKLHIETELPQIMMRVYLYDACFGYWIEDDIDSFLFYLPSEYCEIKSRINGMYGFALKIDSIPNSELPSFPPELRQLIMDARKSNIKKMGSRNLYIPPEKSFCVKYNDFFSNLYPPLFDVIANILDIDDYKGLKKAMSKQEAYRMIAMKIPTNDEGQITMDNKMVVPFVEMAKGIVPDTIGVVPSPMEITPIQFQSDQSDRDKVQEATKQLYTEAGVSESLMSGATSGSMLSLSIKTDSGDIFRLYRQIERAINLHLMMMGISSHPSYVHLFKLLDVTIFNDTDMLDTELKAAQASLPNKFALMSILGVNPSRLLGNQVIENQVFKLGEDWTVLKSSATQSGDSENTGRPKEADEGLSSSGEATRENDTNNPDNRV